MIYYAWVNTPDNGAATFVFDNGTLMGSYPAYVTGASGSSGGSPSVTEHTAGIFSTVCPDTDEIIPTVVQDGKTFYMVGTYKWYEISGGEILITTGTAADSRGGTQPLIPNSDVYWTLTGTSWVWGGAQGAASLSPPRMLPRAAFDNVAASKAAGRVIGKVGVVLNVAATAAEGYDLVNNWDQAGYGDAAKFGIDATLTIVTTTLYLTGVGAPVALILTGVQIANTLGAFDSIYESFNTPINVYRGTNGYGVSGSW